MFSTFFASNALLALLASGVVQVTEAAFAGQKKAAFFIALAISVTLSALQFVDACCPPARYHELALQRVNASYTALLPEIQTAADTQMQKVREELFEELESVRKAAATQNTEAVLAVDKDSILKKYESNSDQYPQDYASDTMFQALVTILRMAESEPESAARTVDETLSNLDAIVSMSRTSKEGHLYRDIRTDLLMVQAVLESQNNTAAAAVQTDITEVRTLLMQQQVDTARLTEKTDHIVENCMDLDLDLTVLADLRGNLAAYAELLELCTELKNHQMDQTRLTAALETAAALPDAEENWSKSKALWQTELATLRAELAASPLSDRGSFMSQVDGITQEYLAEPDLVGKFFTLVCHPFENGLRVAIPAWIAIALAVVLDLAASMSVVQARKLRRLRATVYMDDQTAP